MANFDIAFDFVFKNEVDPKNMHKVIVDSGGVTKYGISQKAHKNVDVEKLTIPEAKTIYYEYWREIQGDKINNQSIATYLFDYAFNSGVSQAVKDLQRSLNDLGSSISVDGKMGNNTLKSVNISNHPNTVLENLKGYRIKLYNYLAKKNPLLYAKSLSGWLKRAAKKIPGNAVNNTSLIFLFTAAGVASYFYFKKRNEN